MEKGLLQGSSFSPVKSIVIVKTIKEVQVVILGFITFAMISQYLGTIWQVKIKLSKYFIPF